MNSAIDGNSALGVHRKLGPDRVYLIVAAILWFGLLIQTLGYHWSSDFRFHTAAIAEFATNPFTPRHVFLPEVLPHHSLSFYHQFWGIFASLTGLSAITVTQIAAMVNATAFLAVFPFFVRVFVKYRYASSVALLVVLLAWGPNAWRLSSLLNLNSLGFGLPYPSFFAVWMSLLLIVLLDRVTRKSVGPSAILLGGLGVLGFLISNAHLISFGSFMVLAVALVWSRRSWPGLAGGLAVLGGAIIGLMLWPYFSLLGVADASNVIDSQNRTVYRSTLVRLAPTLLGLIPLALRFRRNRTDPLALAFAGLTVIYFFGLIIDRYVFGRVIGVAALILQLALAEGILALWGKAKEPRMRLGLAMGGVLVVVVFAGLASAAVVRMVPKALLPAAITDDSRLQSPVGWLNAVDPLLDPDDVILAPLSISTFFPVTSAKIVALGPTPFVEDEKERAEDAARFFSVVDLAILDKYHVTWVAFREDDVSEFTGESIRNLGEAVEVEDIVLVRVQDLPG